MFSERKTIIKLGAACSLFAIMAACTQPTITQIEFCDLEIDDFTPALVAQIRSDPNFDRNLIIWLEQCPETALAFADLATATIPQTTGVTVDNDGGNSGGGDDGSGDGNGGGGDDGSGGDNGGSGSGGGDDGNGGDNGGGDDDSNGDNDNNGDDNSNGGFTPPGQGGLPPNTNGNLTPGRGGIAPGQQGKS